MAAGYLLGRVFSSLVPSARTGVPLDRVPERQLNLAEGHLATYLNDHLAGAVTAIQLLESLENTHADLKPELAALRTDIEQDDIELKALMQRLNIAERRGREFGGWLAEKATQLKLRIDDRAAGSLRLLESLELVSLGIEGKLGLWRALTSAAENSPALRIAGYDRLANRAMDQRRRAESLRLDAARMTLAVPSTNPAVRGDPGF
ncbi:MAG: hypothetical protein ACREQV_21380 [Candidatus Binatia bacterium]